MKTHDFTGEDKDQVNRTFNTFVAKYADFDEEDVLLYVRDKRVPYMGWFWRDTDFAGKKISIGDDGECIGVMENNKWYHPERLMTTDEADTFIDYLDRASQEAQKDGDQTEIKQKVEEVFDQLWDWFQTLVIERED